MTTKTQKQLKARAGTADGCSTESAGAALSPQWLIKGETDMSKLNPYDIYIVIGEYEPGDIDVKLCWTLSRAEDIVHDMGGAAHIRVHHVSPDPWDDEPGEYTPFEDPTSTVSKEITELRFDYVPSPEAESVS
jgi:hypothetical protein